MCIIILQPYKEVGLFMARNPKDRTVSHPPMFSVFKPAGVTGKKLEVVMLELDEYESIRLADYMGFEHEKAAQEMGISRSTFTRLVERARKKVASMLVVGSKIEIEGGSVHFKENLYHCLDCNDVFRVSMQEETGECPTCHSEKLVDFARGFGHGRCCSGHGRSK